MSQMVYRGNLSATTFPLLSSLHGRTVIIKGQDHTYVPAVTAKEDSDKDSGIPQIFYAENVLPHAQGFQAVGYVSEKSPVSGDPAIVGFSSIHPIEDSLGNTGYVTFTSNGDFYTLQSGDTAFVYRLSVPAAAGKDISVAHVSGVTYIYVANTGCYVYNFATFTMTPTTLTGLTAANIIGLTTSSGYLIAWDISTVLWSSLITPTDFTPSLVTGAGGGAVAGVLGAIAFLAPHPNGFYVYAYENIVVAISSGNTRYPFDFKPLAGSGGCQNSNLASTKLNAATSYAYTTYGVQLVTPTGVQSIFPEVTDFLAGSVLETFNSTANTLSTEILTAPMLKKLVVIANRYLVISYGKSTLTHALVYDLQQKRWGKLAITHADCFEYALGVPESVETAKKTFALLKSSGEIVTVDSSLESTIGQGILLLGKFQYVRARLTTIHEVALENIYDHATTSCYILPTLDGKTFLPAVPTVAAPEDTGKVVRYRCRVTGLNNSVLVKGAFHIVSIELTFSNAGSR